MKKIKKMTITEKRKLKDEKAANWFKRIQVAMLKNRGLSNAEVARRTGVTRVAVGVMYKKIKNMTIKELEEKTKLVE